MSAQKSHSSLSPVEGSPTSRTEVTAGEGFGWRTILGSIFAFVLLPTALFLLVRHSSTSAAMALLRVKFAEAIFGLVVLTALISLYAVYQHTLIRRLRSQLADKQDHSQILRNLAMMDQLTGLYNRRFAEQQLATEVSRSIRKGHTLSVVVFDLNNFKMINDKYGHPAGDVVLRKFASHISKAIRGTDFAARMGGDEFLVVLPECSLNQIQAVLSRLGRPEVDWQGQTIPIVWSTGSREYRPGERPDELLSGADEALYENKRANKKSVGPDVVKTQFSDD